MRQNFDDVNVKLQQLGELLSKEVGLFSTAKKRKINRLSQQLNSLSSMNPDDETLAEIEEIKLALNLETDKEKAEWEQKARANCLSFGDRNTTFFHNFSNK